MLDEITRKLRELSEDPSLGEVHRWREKNPGSPVVGYLPAYAPRELVYAAGGLAVGVWGGGITVEIVHGDAYFQSYICRLPRSVIDLAKQGVFEDFQGLIFPSICDVIRNLSGMWKMLFPHQWVKYLDLPQNLDPDVGGRFYERELRSLANLILGREPDGDYSEKLLAAISLTNRQSAVFNTLKGIRQKTPHKIPIDEYYYLFRSALVLHPSEHIRLAESYIEHLEERETREMDNIRVLLIGAFCEQPPVGLLKAIERTGCYIVNHDLIMGLHWFTSPLSLTGDPFKSLVGGYLNKTVMAPFKYQGILNRGEELVKEARKWKVDGVILASPSFCDPSLLERPMLQDALKREEIPFTTFKYAENTGQYQAIKEQTGTFSDSVRLWEVSV